VVRAVPLEQSPAGDDIDLLDDAVDHGLVSRTADRAEVRGCSRVGQDQRRVRWRDQELVPVGREPVARVDSRERLEVAAIDVVRALGEAAEASPLPLVCYCKRYCEEGATALLLHAVFCRVRRLATKTQAGR
jgi:hypothetical protein